MVGDYDWEDAKRVPREFCCFLVEDWLLQGFGTSGLSDYIAAQLATLLGDAEQLVIVMSTVAFITGLTEVV